MSNLKRDLARLLKKYKEETSIVKSEVSQIVKANAFAGNRIAKRKAPKRFGKLAQSIGVDIKRGGLEAEVVVVMLYAPYVEFGTGVKVEVPSEWVEIALAFKGEKEIAGQRPQPFMYPAWQATKKQFTKDMKNYVKSR